jgi:hypothetical protein
MKRFDFNALREAVRKEAKKIGDIPVMREAARMVGMDPDSFLRVMNEHFGPVETTPTEVMPYPVFNSDLRAESVRVSIVIQVKLPHELASKPLEHVIYLNTENKLEVGICRTTVDFDVLTKRQILIDLGKVCSNCGKTDAQFVCNCLCIFFCSKKCRLEFAPVHREHCPSIPEERNHLALLASYRGFFDRSELFTCIGCLYTVPLQKGVFKCKECKISYCSPECQKTDWKRGVHKVFCHVFSFQEAKKSGDQAKMTSAFNEVATSICTVAMKMKNPANTAKVCQIMPWNGLENPADLTPFVGNHKANHVWQTRPP